MRNLNLPLAVVDPKSHRAARLSDLTRSETNLKSVDRSTVPEIEENLEAKPKFESCDEIRNSVAPLLKVSAQSISTTETPRQGNEELKEEATNAAVIEVEARRNDSTVCRLWPAL
jgi:hypothetical protein